MSILFKLVGLQSSEGIRTDMNFFKFDQSKETVNVKEVEDFFIELGLAPNDDVKYITESQTMSPDNNYKVNKDSQKIIYVFTLNADIKSTLVEIFKKNGIETTTKPGNVIEKNISKPVPFENLKIDESIINKSNTETIKLFGEEDFKSLLSIFVNNPDMFKRFSSYITSGDVIVESEKFSIEGENEYTSEFEEIMSLGLKISDEEINNALQKFNGHLNLSLRYLLYQESIKLKS